MWPLPFPYLLAGVALALVITGGVGYYKGRADGRTAQLKATVEAYRKREGIDDEVHGMGDIALCRALGGGVLCDGIELRGLEAPKP